ncbi:hypothetical protein, partial [Exiguobacterium sp. A1_3_1]|uniref:hypothetical protein n=1 Tax=Exiguobacterium sp. A1_3_1 TaxID=2651871 RepID=UPI003B984C60
MFSFIVLLRHHFLSKPGFPNHSINRGITPYPFADSSIHHGALTSRLRRSIARTTVEASRSFDRTIEATFCSYFRSTSARTKNSVAIGPGSVSYTHLRAH